MNDKKLPSKYVLDPNQAGVTLLLAILVLSSILAISFSVAAILLVEVRTSGDLFRTENAFYGAEAVGEEALFKIKRGVPSGSFSYTSQIGPVGLNSPAPVENVFNDATQRVVILPGTTFSTASHYRFFNPNATDQNAGSGYGKMVLTNLSTNSSDAVTIYLCQFNPKTVTTIPCTDPNDNTYWLVRGQTLTSVQAPVSVDQDTGFFDPGKQQELLLYNSSNDNIYLQIQTFAQETSPGQFVALGLPYFGQKSVDINAINSGVGRKLRVVVPINDFSSTVTGTTQSQTVSENQTASLTCNAGTIISFTSKYGSNCAGTCPVSCGSCTIGAASCSVTYNNTNCGDCNVGCAKNGDLSITCAGTTPFAHHRIITVNAGQVPSTQSNFPVLVSITNDATLKSAANGGNVQSSSGTDIVFTSDAAGNSVIPYEQESYDPTTGTLKYWVQLSSISTGTTFYMFYDKAGATDQSNKTGVWDSNYKLIYHMADNAANTTVKDSLGSNNGTSAANTSVKTMAGQVDGALNFNGSSDRVTTSGFIGPANNVTLEAWVKPSSVPGGQKIIFQGGSSADTYLRLETSNTNHFRTYFGTGGGWGGTTATDSTAAVLTSFTHLVAVHDNTNNKTLLYVNGSLDINASDNVVPGASPGIVVGGYLTGNETYDFPGVVDEVRVSGNVRSADWIKTEYNNQSSPAAFENVSAEQTP